MRAVACTQGEFGSMNLSLPRRRALDMLAQAASDMGFDSPDDLTSMLAEHGLIVAPKAEILHVKTGQASSGGGQLCRYNNSLSHAARGECWVHSRNSHILRTCDEGRDAPRPTQAKDRHWRCMGRDGCWWVYVEPGTSEQRCWSSVREVWRDSMGTVHAIRVEGPGLLRVRSSLSMGWTTLREASRWAEDGA
jgi:hypothetical protein